MATKKFCVIGLGYFGLNLSLHLNEAGAEVMVIDNQQEKVNAISDKVTHAVCMDSADKESMRSMGIKDMDAVIVAIGEGFESSIMTTALVQELGAKKIFARVTSLVHERILKLMNVSELLVPEAFAASKLAARLMNPGLIESFEINKDYGIFEIAAPKFFIDKTLLELNLRQIYKFNLVTLKRIIKKRGLLTLGEKEEVEVIGIPSPDLTIKDGDILVLFGKESNLKLLLEN
jgi:trk system potassium uptake protein